MKHQWEKEVNILLESVMRLNVEELKQNYLEMKDFRDIPVKQIRLTIRLVSLYVATLARKISSAN